MGEKEQADKTHADTADAELVLLRSPRFHLRFCLGPFFAPHLAAILVSLSQPDRRFAALGTDLVED